ncbi:MAG: hypothetical protein KF744_08420 [Taibaiella sp.]|nr:hypothetical protein [Taibaiella sp.]
MRLLSVLLVCGVSLVASMPANAQKKAAPTGSKPHKVLMPQAFLGNSDKKGGMISRDEFTKLVKQGLQARDSAGNRYRVTGFEFMYGERQMYEDSVGRPMVMFDYLSEYCPGDTLSPGVAMSLYSRLKAGDTAYFNRVEVLRVRPGEPGGTVIMGKGMKFALTR